MIINTIEQYLEMADELQVTFALGKNKQKILIPCVGSTALVRRDLVQANNWNPNSVPEDKMELLRQSIIDNGIAYAVSVSYDPDLQKFVVIDGFHRYTMCGPEWLDLEYVPVVILNLTPTQRMTATWQFNKARGMHQVDLDADLIRALIGQGMPEDKIAQHLGIDLDTVYRYKQVTGIAELFKGSQYSMSWEMVEVSDGE